MKFTVSLILTALLSFAAGLYLDWWSLALASFVVALCIPQKPWQNWLAGFLGLFLLWGGLAIWLDIRNQHLLSGKVARILPLGGSAVALVLVTAFAAALVAGFAALSGSYARRK